MRNELKTTKGLVKVILQEIPQTRNNDSLLYLKVIQAIARVKGIDLEKISIPTFLVCLPASPFPCFESVRRSRAKLQSEYPELLANVKIQEYRAKNEAVFREFVRS